MALTALVVLATQLVNSAAQCSLNDDLWTPARAPERGFVIVSFNPMHIEILTLDTLVPVYGLPIT